MGVHAIQTQQQICGLCQGNHPNEECQVANPFTQTRLEQSQYVRNFNRQNNPYSNSYNLGWENHSHFSQKSNQNMGNFQSEDLSSQQDQMSTLEETMLKLANTNQFMTKTRNNFQNQATQIISLEVQISQLAYVVNSHPQDNFPNNTEVNPRE